jgi:hypothetical protein
LGDIFDAGRGQLLKKFACDEIIPRASFEGKVHDDSLDFGAFESEGREFKFVGGF